MRCQFAAWPDPGTTKKLVLAPHGYVGTHLFVRCHERKFEALVAAWKATNNGRDGVALGLKRIVVCEELHLITTRWTSLVLR